MKKLAMLLTIMLTIPSLTLFAGDDEKAVNECINKEAKAFVDKNFDAWADCWAHEPYITLITAGAFQMNVVKSWDSLSAQTKKYFESEQGLSKLTKENFDTHIMGDMAVVYADEQISTKYAGQNYDQTNTGVYTLKKMDGNWKIVSISAINRSSYEANDAITEWQINMAGYKLLWNKQIDKAIRVFTLNTELFPNAFNTWDSLGEAHMKNGNKEKAIECYKKSLALNAQNTNAQKMIDKMQQEEEED